MSTWLAVRFGTAEAGETPTVGTRIAFAKVAGPGTRALDGAVRRHRERELDDARALVMSGDRFTLLLFDGRATTGAGYATLAAIAQRVQHRFGDRIATSAVVAGEDRPAALPGQAVVLHDVARELEAPTPRPPSASTSCGPISTSASAHSSPMATPWSPTSSASGVTAGGLSPFAPSW